MWDTLVECRIRLHKALVAANCLPLPETWQSLINTSSTSAPPLSLDSFQEESKHSVAQLTQSLLQLHTLLAKNLTVKEKKLTKKVERRQVNDSQLDETGDKGEEDSISEASEEEIGEKSFNSDDDDPHHSQEEGEGEEEDDDDDDDEHDGIQDQPDRQQSRGTGDNRMDVDFSTDESFVLAQDALNDVQSIDSVIESRMQKLSGKKNTILQEWFERTRFSLAQGLESFEQPPLTQITAILANKKRLIKRTQLKRCEYNLVGKRRNSLDDSTVNQVEDQLEQGKSKLSDLVAYETKNNQESNYDVEIFNDDDFYHQLLKELIDTKSADSTDCLSLSKKWQTIQKMRGKMRKVDTRASKGRKIRFKVHKEIINFMAPIALTSMDETARNALFTSVFSR